MGLGLQAAFLSMTCARVEHGRTEPDGNGSDAENEHLLALAIAASLESRTAPAADDEQLALAIEASLAEEMRSWECGICAGDMGDHTSDGSGNEDDQLLWPGEAAGETPRPLTAESPAPSPAPDRAEVSQNPSPHTAPRSSPTARGSTTVRLSDSALDSVPHPWTSDLAPELRLRPPSFGPSAALAVLAAACAALARRLLPFVECEICFVRTFVLLLHRNAECTHRCCGRCWAGYLQSTEADATRRMRHARCYALTCWGCDAPLSRRTLAWFGPPRLHRCVELLDRRAALIANKPRAFRLVECPRMGCVGVAYDDGRSLTAMCFLCTEQWPVERGLFAGLWAAAKRWWPKRIDGVAGWRPCPHCGAAILKNGGCPMMRCALCRKAFRWGATHNTIHDVVEAHAPR
eukprot:scaffold15003_cov100-Isochrysis_galbana.AAC.3